MGNGEKKGICKGKCVVYLEIAMYCFVEIIGIYRSLEKILYRFMKSQVYLRMYYFKGKSVDEL